VTVGLEHGLVRAGRIAQRRPGLDSDVMLSAILRCIVVVVKDVVSHLVDSWRDCGLQALKILAAPVADSDGAQLAPGVVILEHSYGG